MAVSKNKSHKRRISQTRKRLVEKTSENVKIGQIYQNGYKAGFSKGFEDGHQLAYEQQP